MKVITTLFESLFEIVFVALAAYFAIKWLRPRTTREILGRPMSFFERLQPTVESYGEARTTAERDEHRADAERVFEKALEDHRLSTADFRLELAIDELGLAVARIRRVSDDRSWTLLDFDDHLLEKPLPAPSSAG